MFRNARRGRGHTIPNNSKFGRPQFAQPGFSSSQQQEINPNCAPSVRFQDQGPNYKDFLDAPMPRPRRRNFGAQSAPCFIPPNQYVRPNVSMQPYKQRLKSSIQFENTDCRNELLNESSDIAANSNESNANSNYDYSTNVPRVNRCCCFSQPCVCLHNAEDQCETTAIQMKQLENKQKAMECSMRRLLRSMRDLRLNEKSSGNTVELDRRRRLKLTRMIQILMLQRRNMQLQNDTLRKEVMTLTRKFMALRNRAERLVVENIDMRKYYSETKSENDRKTLQIENLIQGKSMMEKEIQDRTDLKVEIENLKFEIRRLLVENHNLKQSLQKSEKILMVKVQQKETLELENGELRAKLIKLETQEANLRVRFERISFQNEALLKENEINQSNRHNADIISQEYDTLREKHEELIRNFNRLEKLYSNESEQRKVYHNQLQEVRGNIRVLCRCKPCGNDEAFQWIFKSTDKIMVPSEYMRLLSKGDNGCYSFNRVYRPLQGNQQEIFEDVKPLLSSCIDGYNVCVMAYGPTGSGKTFTMIGTRDEPGITLRAISELSEMCASLRSTWNIVTHVAMFEIYNDVIYDLLNKHIVPVKLSDDGTDVRILDAKEKLAKTEQDILYWIATGHKRRKVAETKMNMQSSRSHLIIRLQLVMENISENTQRTSTLIFCDLAGSENSEFIHATGQLKVETGYINKSLVALGRVLECLKTRASSIPYRDTKLTHLLKPCLGGDAKCVLIIAVASDKGRVDRTINALQFGSSAMHVALGKPRQNTQLIPNKVSYKARRHRMQVESLNQEGIIYSNCRTNKSTR